MLFTRLPPHLGVFFLLHGFSHAAPPPARISASDVASEFSSMHNLRPNPLSMNRILGRELFDPDNPACSDSSPYYEVSGRSPFFFAYYEQAFKDFSSYFEIGEFSGVFTDLLELFKAPCEFTGGTLYNITGSQTCFDHSNTLTDLNLPYCAPKGCVIDEETVEASEEFDYCNNRTGFDFNVAVMKPIMNEECNQELLSFSAEAGGPGKFFSEFVEDLDEFLIGEIGNIVTLDFTPLLENMTTVCEAEGGFLYKYSDTVNYDGDFEEQYLNIPICIGPSCDAEKYFEEVFEPTLMFALDGNFRDLQDDGNGTYYFAGNGTYPLENKYEFQGYEAVSNVTTPPPSQTTTNAPTTAPALSPTKVPTIAPTLSPTKVPSKAPTLSPTKAPSKAPTLPPTKAPSKAPTVAPTIASTKVPSINTPTKSPTVKTTNAPIKAPTPSSSASKTGASLRKMFMMSFIVSMMCSSSFLL